MISFQNVSKDFGSLRVLNHLSFEIQKGEIVGLLGPNGAGKTTAMRILAGFFPPTKGKVTVAGLDVTREPVPVKRRIGYLPERVSLYPDFRVEEFLRFVAHAKGVPRNKVEDKVEEKMVRCGVLSVRDRLIGHLSKGYVQRVGLAQALLGEPELLLLDEPTSGLDPRQIVEIRELIQDLGRERTLILSTHILPEVSRICERVLILNQGRIMAQGRPDELEQGLRDRQEIIIRIGTRAGEEVPRPEEASGETPPLQQILLSVPGVESAEKVTEEDSVATYLLRTAPDENLRAEVSRRVVEAGFPLLELSVRRLSLEDIFVKLVLSEEMASWSSR